MKQTNLSPAADNQLNDNQNDTPQPAPHRCVHNLIILDESGSMHSIYRPALSGVNETLQTIRSAQAGNPNQEHFVTLVTFDTRPDFRYNEIYHNVEAAKAVDINEGHYQPNGCTPLYDAMGRAINEMRECSEADDVVLVTIITDGYENASCEYSGTAIKALVEDMRSKGWVFTYIGANQDVEKVADSMSINNHLAFSADEAGTAQMFEKESKARKNFFAKVNLMGCFSLQDDYFKD